jgi:hypothetical protein
MRMKRFNLQEALQIQEGSHLILNAGREAWPMSLCPPKLPDLYDYIPRAHGGFAQ